MFRTRPLPDVARASGALSNAAPASPTDHRGAGSGVRLWAVTAAAIACILAMPAVASAASEPSFSTANGGEATYTNGGATGVSLTLRRSSDGTWRLVRAQVDGKDAGASGLSSVTPEPLQASTEEKWRAWRDQTAPPPPTAPSAVPSVWRRFASFETTLTADTNGLGISSPHLTTRTSEVGAAHGSWAAKIQTNGGNSGCSCPRSKFEDVTGDPGSEVWLTGAWYLPNPSQIGESSRLFNLGKYAGNSTDHLISLRSYGNGRFAVVRGAYGAVPSVLIPARPLPGGRWFRVWLHLRLSTVDGEALTELYLDEDPSDGLDDPVKVGASTARNLTFASRLHFAHFGLSFFAPGPNTAAYYDAIGVSD
jgi:hypothetical protein